MKMNRQSLDHQVWVKLLEERHKQSSGVFSAVLQSDQRDRNQDAGGGLISQLGARGKSEIAMMNDFKVVIGKPDRAKRHRGKHSDPHKRIAQVRPEQRRHQDGDGDQQAAHGRRASFLLVSLRTLFAYVLPDLEIAQAPNHDRPNDQSSKKRGEAGKGCAESQITENTEGRKVMEELQVEQPVEQSASNTSSRFSVLSSQFPTPRAEGMPLFRLAASRRNKFLSVYPRGPLCSPWFRLLLVATSPTLSPASHRETPSTVRHRPRESRAPATRQLPPASRQIPLSYPLREPPPPSASPGPARRAGIQVYFLQCNARTRDAVARRLCRVPASRRRQQSAAAPASLPEYPRQP